MNFRYVAVFGIFLCLLGAGKVRAAEAVDPTDFENTAALTATKIEAMTDEQAATEFIATADQADQRADEAVKEGALDPVDATDIHAAAANVRAATKRQGFRNAVALSLRKIRNSGIYVAKLTAKSVLEAQRYAEDAGLFGAKQIAFASTRVSTMTADGAEFTAKLAYVQFLRTVHAIDPKKSSPDTDPEVAQFDRADVVGGMGLPASLEFIGANNFAVCDSNHCDESDEKN